MVNPFKVAANVGRAARRAIDTNTRPAARQSVSSATVDRAPVREYAKAVVQEVSAMHRASKDARANSIVRKQEEKQRAASADNRRSNRRRTSAASRG
jgi:hypothetical protein